jgi:hypothetical protein
MSGSNYGRDGRSSYLEGPRPSYLQRQRSNSLPPNSFLANATEVGMMFSAAEKASARRKRTYSVDYSSTPSTPFDTFLESNIFPAPPSHSTQKTSPLRQATTVRQSVNKPLPPDPLTTPIMREQLHPTSKKAVPPAIELPESLLQQLPVSPLSPKRQVVSPSLKSYADSLLQFTHNRLISTIPVVQVTSPDQLPPHVSEPVSLRPLRSSRPAFESKFSDWSTTNQSSTQSSPDEDPAVPGLMSPDSFFGVQQPPANYYEYANSGLSFPSSETFEQSDMILPPTPPQDDQEISYFTNFDRFLDSETWPVRQASNANESPLDSVIIDLSPIDRGPATPSEQVLKSITGPTRHRRRSTAATIIRHISASAPLLSAGMPPCSVSPMTPVHVAELAIRVPGCWIGAIG